MKVKVKTRLRDLGEQVKVLFESQPAKSLQICQPVSHLIKVKARVLFNKGVTLKI